MSDLMDHQESIARLRVWAGENKTSDLPKDNVMNKPKLALNPAHPERICWGCDKYCSADDLRCGNGTIRTQHPAELFGPDWLEWELGASESTAKVANSADFDQ